MFLGISSAYLAVPPVALCLVFCFYLWRAKRHDLPPGPPRVPFLGNILQLPSIDQHKTFTGWAVQYGDIVYAEFFTQPVVIVNSLKCAYDLMEKRSARYSERPRFVRIVDMIGWSGNSAFMQYDNRWKRHRKRFQRAFVARSAINSYHPLQLREVRRLLYDLLQSPNDFAAHLKRFGASMIFEMGYGHAVTSLDGDQFIKLVEAGITEALGGSGSGLALVDFFPMLKYIPTWMPGAGFKRGASMARDAVAAMEDIPYNTVKHDMESGVAKPSFTTAMIEDCMKNGELTKEDESDIKGAAGTLYSAGTDTSLTSMIVFVLVMVQYPDVFRKAQDELLRVVGDTRLPDYEDRASLPYLECIIKEVYRWCPAVPTAIPHQAADEDVYRGYYIPKGSMIIPNIWAMLRDPEVYPEPDVFRPERFFGMATDKQSVMKDPKKIVFGFGRRVCPGQYFADNNVWLAAASIIATMDIRKARNAHGEEVTPTPKFLSGTVIHPEPFVCSIQARSEKSRQLILDSVTEV